MRRVAWTPDDGPAIVFDENGPYHFNTIASDLGATAETSRAPRQNGVTTYHVALDTRTIDLTGSMWVLGDRSHPARARYDAARSALCQSMAPNRWGTLVYHREDRAVQVRCRSAATPTFSPPVGTYSTFDVTFITDSPFWESADEYVVSLGVTQRFWHFPWTPRRSPLGSFDRFASIHNPAAEPVYPTVEVYATGQHITLTNRTTGESVTIEHAIGAGEKLTVDMKDISAYLYRPDGAGGYAAPEDVSHWMSLDSVPWGLVPGDNIVAITNEVPEDTPVSYIRYRELYLGI